MLITCPKCESKARIATSKAITKDTREAYCQCMNLNCGVIFVTYTSVCRIIEPTGKKPNPNLQPELCKLEDVNQVDMFG
ncbi:zinc-binding protein [Aliivibrio fischeri]|uniref:ogr/Delta-like zinc finger family protein n=1 Tax=Aliivibrio fischeri TaxID=668 RepID=UPI00080DC0AE|nr:ogr/Delta-like zinc finger family protein [Aliivibrio fischeri]OCH26237.1 zinc-binding protein [Aliivibrio fischeri]